MRKYTHNEILKASEEDPWTLVEDAYDLLKKKEGNLIIANPALTVATAAALVELKKRVEALEK